MKKTEVKRKHHYVPQRQLKNWSLDKTNIWHITKRGKISLFGIKGLAVENDLYKFGDISETEEKFIIYFIKSNLDNEGVNIIDSLMKPALEAIRAKRLVNKIDEIIPINEKISKTINTIESNFIEDNLEAVEKDFGNLTDKMIKDFKIKLEYEEKLIILIYLSHQLMRTKEQKENMLKPEKNSDFIFNGISTDTLLNKTWPMIAFLYGWKKSYLLSKKPLIFNLLINNTNEEFITNSNALANIGTHDAEKYYIPISPKIALLVSVNNGFEDDQVDLSLEEVRWFNLVMANMNSHTLFSSSRECLLRVKEQLKTHRRRTKAPKPPQNTV